MKFSSFLASSSLLLVTAVAACGGDDPDPVDPIDPVDPNPPAFTAEFGGASEDQLRRAAIAGSAGDAVIATIFTSFFAGVDDPTGCPAIATVGSVTTVTGGCTTGDGTAFTGSLVLTNVPSWSGTGSYDPSQPSTYQFDNYSLDDGIEQPFVFDGLVETSSTGMTVELLAEVFGIEATSSLDLVAAADGNMTANEGSVIDVSGLGTAEVSGTWSYNDPPTGAFTLTGADVITFDFDDAVADCIPYSIDGELAGELCDPEEQQKD